MTQLLNEAIKNYEKRVNRAFGPTKAVLFDMDGVLYDSMPLHATAWQRMCSEAGLITNRDEFFSYEGMTGVATIKMLFMQQKGINISDEEARRLYAVKGGYFEKMGSPPIITGAQDAVRAVLAARLPAVLVTGSAQASVLSHLATDYPEAFDIKVTALDVKNCKPHPEPYLKGMEKAGVEPWQAIAIDNAPLGVESASRAGAFTIGVRTGPIPEGSLKEAGADIEINSMVECTKILSELL